MSTIRIPFPFGGVNETIAFNEDKPVFSLAIQNVVPFAGNGDELRGGKREGTSRAIADQVDGSNPIQRMGQVTLSGDSFIDPGDFFDDPLYKAGSGDDGLGFGGGFLRPQPDYYGGAYWPIDDNVKEPVLNILGNMDIWDSSRVVGTALGKSFVSTIGQVFSTDLVNATLSKIKFQYEPFVAANDNVFRIYLAKWDSVNSRVLSVEFTGPEITVTGGNPTAPIEAIVNDIPLEPGQSYVVFVSTSEAAGGASGGGYLGGVNEVFPATGGGLVILDDNGDPGKWLTESWDVVDYDNLAFELEVYTTES